MMDIITGKTRPDEGTVMFEARSTSPARRSRDRQLGIGRKFQKPTVFESHTVEDNICSR
jgi:urea transport system ATP-binding protein